MNIEQKKNNNNKMFADNLTHSAELVQQALTVHNPIQQQTPFQQVAQ